MEKKFNRQVSVWVTLALFVIFLLAVFFRFFNYTNRWGLASDQARDAIIIERSIQSHTLPLIGPFSASEPFVFGPSWYIFFIVFTSVFPQWILTPWIVQSVIFTLMVFAMVKIGEEIEQKSLGLLLGLFTAISTAQITLSTNLIFSALVSCIAVGCLYYFLQCLKKDSVINFFLLGLLLSVAITVHFQAIPLLIVVVIAWAKKRMKPKYLVYSIGGFIIPFIPLIIFDAQTGFYESTHLVQFFLFNHDAYITKRWLIYAGQFWPNVWGDVIGGNLIIGALLMVVSLGITAYQIGKKQLNREMSYCLIAFAAIFILLRYFRGILFEGFLSFLHPLILLITAWVCLQIYKMHKIIGFCFILVIVILTTESSLSAILHSTNNTDKETQILENVIETRYPNRTYALYDYQYKNTSQSLPLSLFILMKQENNINGIRIGLANRLLQDPLYPLIYHTELPYPIYVYDLNHATVGNIKNDQWILVNPRTVYSSIEDWYK